jgi:hypothetical protein
MQTTNFAKELLNFNKDIVKISFDTLTNISSQAAQMTDSCFELAPYLPEEGKKVVGLYVKESQKSLASVRKHIEKGLEIDWTSKETPAKGLETLESFCNNAFSQASDIKKETKGLFDKTVKQLPKESKPLVDLWIEAVNSGFDIFEGCVKKNFELAQEILASVSAESGKAESPKAQPVKAETKDVK